MHFHLACESGIVFVTHKKAFYIAMATRVDLSKLNECIFLRCHIRKETLIRGGQFLIERSSHPCIIIIILIIELLYRRGINNN